MTPSDPIRCPTIIGFFLGHKFVAVIAGLKIQTTRCVRCDAPRRPWPVRKDQ